MRWDRDELAADWFEGADLTRAVFAARAFIDKVCRGEIDPVAHVNYLELAAEVLADGPGGDPARAMTCVRNVQPAFLDAQKNYALRSDAWLLMRGRPSVLLARTEHRVLGEGRSAFETALGALTWIEDMAEGRTALRGILRQPVPSVLGELAIAALGIYPAAARRGLQMTPDIRRLYIRHAVDLVEAYLDPASDPVIYPRSEALIQWMYALIELDQPEHSFLIHQIHAFDVAHRPATARSKTTIPLRESSYARFLGKQNEFEQASRAATQSLADFPLPRHSEFVAKYRYLTG